MSCIHILQFLGFATISAISFAIGVERPQSTGIGGGGFLLFKTDKMQEPMSIDFREKAPLRSTKDMYLDKNGKVLSRKSLDGIFAVGVPGLVAGVLEIHHKYGRLPLQQVLEQLGCSERRFYQLLKKYKESPDEFTISYARSTPNRCLPEEIEEAIREELEIDRGLIGDKETTIQDYNYSSVRDEIIRRYGYKVSAQTIRNRAKKWGYWIPKERKKKAHTGRL